MIKGFKTIIFNSIMTIVLILRTWGVDVDVDMDQVQNNLDALNIALVSFWGIGNIILRAITDTPIFNRKKGHNT